MLYLQVWRNVAHKNKERAVNDVLAAFQRRWRREAVWREQQAAVRAAAFIAELEAIYEAAEEPVSDQMAVASVRS